MKMTKVSPTRCRYYGGRRSRLETGIPVLHDHPDAGGVETVVKQIFCVICAGGAIDFSLSHWPFIRELVDEERLVFRVLSVHAYERNVPLIDFATED